MKTHPKDAEVDAGSTVSPKLDGVYARATAGGLESKGGKQVASQAHVHHGLRGFFKRNPKAVLHGELYRHGDSFENIVSDFKGGGGKLQYHVFPHNKTIPAASKWVRHVKGTVVNSHAAAEKHYSQSLKDGYEGQVVHSPQGAVAKRKPQQDSEYRVTHARVGKKHGVLTVAGKAGEVFRVQAPAAHSDDSSVGKHVTVGYVRKTRNGIPHAPVFKGLRDYEASALNRRIVEFARCLQCIQL